MNLFELIWTWVSLSVAGFGFSAAVYGVYGAVMEHRKRKQ